MTTKTFITAGKQLLSIFLIIIYSAARVLPAGPASAQMIFNLPDPGAMVGSSSAFVPVLLKGMTIHPENPLRFDFIVDSGNTTFTPDQIKEESSRLVKYFLAAMTVPQDNLWVNLSPYEENRIIPDELGKTELGRDMLAQDYLLKQLSATLMHPEKALGKEFWKEVRQKARSRFCDVDIPMDTFNKIWIMPQDVAVYEYEKTVYITNSRLKVMTEQDYLAVEKKEKAMQGDSAIALLQNQIIKEVILPEIEREVNEGKNFAPIRQIYHSLILAQWYKETVKESLLSKVYVDQNKIKGVDLDDPTVKDQIYAKYSAAFTTGVFNYIKEDYDELSGEVIPRQYFSGGEIFKINIRRDDPQAARDAGLIEGYDLTLKIDPMKEGKRKEDEKSDGAMLGSSWASSYRASVVFYLEQNTGLSERNKAYVLNHQGVLQAKLTEDVYLETRVVVDNSWDYSGSVWPERRHTVSQEIIVPFDEKKETEIIGNGLNIDIVEEYSYSFLRTQPSERLLKRFILSLNNYNVESKFQQLVSWKKGGEDTIFQNDLAMLTSAEATIVEGMLKILEDRERFDPHQIKDIVILGNYNLEVFRETLRLFQQSGGKARIVITGGRGRSIDTTIAVAKKFGVDFSGIDEKTVSEADLIFAVMARMVEQEEEFKDLREGFREPLRPKDFKLNDGGVREQLGLTDAKKFSDFQKTFLPPMQNSSVLLERNSVNTPMNFKWYKAILDQEAPQQSDNFQIVYLQTPHQQLRSQATFNKVFYRTKVRGFSHTVKYGIYAVSREQVIQDVLSEAWRLILYSPRRGNDTIQFDRNFEGTIRAVPKEFWDNAVSLLRHLAFEEQKSLVKELTRMLEETKKNGASLSFDDVLSSKITYDEVDQFVLTVKDPQRLDLFDDGTSLIEVEIAKEEREKIHLAAEKLKIQVGRSAYSVDGIDEKEGIDVFVATLSHWHPAVREEAHEVLKKLDLPRDFLIAMYLQAFKKAAYFVDQWNSRFDGEMPKGWVAERLAELQAVEAIPFLEDELQKHSSGSAPYSSIERPLQQLQKIKSDQAMIASEDVGGIDMNRINLDRKGQGIDIKIDPVLMQDILTNGVDGFIPVIIDLTPINSVLPLLGLGPDDELGPADKPEELTLSEVN